MPRSQTTAVCVTLLLCAASLVQAGVVQDALQRTATRGRERMLAATRDALRAIGSVGSSRHLQMTTADCTANPNAGCCPMQTSLANLASSSTTCASLGSFDPNATLPVLTEAQIALVCSSSCVTDANAIFLGFNNVTDPTGCFSVTSLKVFSDVLCMRDMDNGGYCYNTLQTLLSYRDNPAANTSQVVGALCTRCGRSLMDYMFTLPLLQRQVLDVDRFLPKAREILPFFCARDPDDDEMCLENDDKREDSRDPCSFCGRNAIRAGADDLNNDMTVAPLLNCGCGEKSRGQRCTEIFVNANISYSGTGSINGTGNVNGTEKGDKDNFTPCLGLMQGTETTCSAECASHLQDILDDTGCCSHCLLIGYNVTGVHGALPPMETVLANLRQCAGQVDSDNLDDMHPCQAGDMHVVEQNLTITNMRYSWLSENGGANRELARTTVTHTLAKAAGVDDDSVHILDIIDGNNSVIFKYQMNSTTTSQGTVFAQSIVVVSDQAMLDLRPLEALALPDINAAVYNISAPFNTSIDTKTSTTSGASATVAMSSMMVAALLAVAGVLLM